MIKEAAEREFETTTEKNCPICNSDKAEFMLKKYDDRFGQPDDFNFYFCNRCNVAFIENKIRKDLMADLYGIYYVTGNSDRENLGFIRKIMIKFGLYEIIINKLGGNKILLASAKNGSRVLEIGSGFSEKTKDLIIKKQLVWKGLEVDKDAIRKIKQAGLECYHGTIDTIEIKEKFDIVILSQAIEHQYDINSFFSACKKLLNPGGIILFITPNLDSIYRKKYGDSWINWHAPYHNILLSRKGLRKISKKHGYEIEKYYSFTPTSWYFLQRNFKIPGRGEKNTTFNFNFPLIPQLFISLFLRIREFFSRNDNDCIYCEFKFIKN